MRVGVVEVGQHGRDVEAACGAGDESDGDVAAQQAGERVGGLPYALHGLQSRSRVGQDGLVEPG